MTSDIIENQTLDALETKELSKFILDSSSLGSELFIKNISPNQPVLTNWMKNNRKILGDNPTVRYQSFFLSNNFEYVITGSLKNLEFVTFQLYSLLKNENIPTNIISSKNFKNFNNDNFELIVSPVKYSNKNSLLTVEKDYILIIREFYKNDLMKDSHESSLQVKNISNIKNYDISLDKPDFEKVNDFTQGTLLSTFNLYEQLKESPTSEIEEKFKLALFPTKGNYYEGEEIDLEDDEVYEVTVHNLPKNLDFIWTFYNIFSRTPDYKKYNVYLNNHNTEYTSRNTYKFYLSKIKIPDLKNSIETGGYSRGILSLRISSKNIPKNFDYDIKKIKINQIKK
ncbi:MAG: hypothetical protein ACRC0S_04260 [Fusobacteriaceae bacterium]